MKIRLSSRVTKFLKKTSKPNQLFLIQKLKNICNDSEFKKARLKGHKNIYRVRVQDYRIVYKVSKREVYIVLVGHRKEIYKLLERMGI